MHKEQLREMIIEVLTQANLLSVPAVDLLMGTAAVESQRGYYWRQIKGPALGIFQMEPRTERDIWENYLKYKHHLRTMMAGFGYEGPDETRLKYDLRYQILMARIHYLRIKAPIPATLAGQADYWKAHYNTHLGAGTPEKYLKAYEEYVL